MNGKINSIILPVILFLALIFSPFSSSAQQIIVTEEGDTLVTITPAQVTIINSVFSDNKWLKEKTKLQAEQIKLLDTRVEKADTIILNYSMLTEDMKKEMAMKEIAWENTTKKKSRKAFWLGGLAGVIVTGVITTLILAR